MIYRKLGRESKKRRSILANITRDVIMNESVVTTEARAKEALAFLYNDDAVVSKVFNELAKRYETRNGGYTRIVKLKERVGDDALSVKLELV